MIGIYLQLTVYRVIILKSIFRGNNEEKKNLSDFDINSSDNIARRYINRYIDYK